MNRREFLKAAGLVGGATLIGAPSLLGIGNSSSSSRAAPTAAPFIRPDRMLNSPVSECPIDTVVVLMMENRSFDHYFGFLATDDPYLDEGRRRHGKDFSIDGRADVIYTDEFGRKVAVCLSLS